MVLPLAGQRPSTTHSPSRAAAQVSRLRTPSPLSRLSASQPRRGASQFRSASPTQSATLPLGQTSSASHRQDKVLSFTVHHKHRPTTSTENTSRYQGLTGRPQSKTSGSRTARTQLPGMSEKKRVHLIDPHTAFLSFLDPSPSAREDSETLQMYIIKDAIQHGSRGGGGGRVGPASSFSPSRHGRVLKGNKGSPSSRPQTTTISLNPVTSKSRGVRVRQKDGKSTLSPSLSRYGHGSMHNASFYSTASTSLGRGTFPPSPALNGPPEAGGKWHFLSVFSSSFPHSAFCIRRLSICVHSISPSFVPPAFS